MASQDTSSTTSTQSPCSSPVFGLQKPAGRGALGSAVAQRTSAGTSLVFARFVLRPVLGEEAFEAREGRASRRDVLEGNGNRLFEVADLKHSLIDLKQTHADLHKEFAHFAKTNESLTHSLLPLSPSTLSSAPKILSAPNDTLSTPQPNSSKPAPPALVVDSQQPLFTPISLPTAPIPIDSATPIDTTAANPSTSAPIHAPPPPPLPTPSIPHLTAPTPTTQSTTPARRRFNPPISNRHRHLFEHPELLDENDQDDDLVFAECSIFLQSLSQMDVSAPPPPPPTRRAGAAILASDTGVSAAINGGIKTPREPVHQLQVDESIQDGVAVTRNLPKTQQDTMEEDAEDTEFAIVRDARAESIARMLGTQDFANDAAVLIRGRNKSRGASGGGVSRGRGSGRGRGRPRGRGRGAGVALMGEGHGVSNMEEGVRERRATTRSMENVGNEDVVAVASSLRGRGRKKARLS
ncbi:hypothetical protein HDU98_010736 [Podochytrium sp. JEL0797]|nr:hypothetical protein HDU98_010736 [Podochytrium sp. JEL0797]